MMDEKTYNEMAKSCNRVSHQHYQLTKKKKEKKRGTQNTV